MESSNGKEMDTKKMLYENELTKRDSHPALQPASFPAVNCWSSDEFQARVAKVFAITADVLGKSYGPYGSSTIISDYPFSHATKDGYTIMKHISFSKEFSVVDDAIKHLIEAPCFRLNYAVGDGTTTAIIAVNSVYQEYIENLGKITEMKIPPRDVMKSYNRVRDMIIRELDSDVIEINTKEHDDMVRTMEKIAYIASNADDNVTSLIRDLYDELDYPLIDLKKSTDADTKTKVIKGYFFNAVLKDELYVNNDDFTAKVEDCDVLLFDHKVMDDTFSNIIIPLNEVCRQMERNLIIIAPMYDDIAMMKMRQVLIGEFKATGKINMILMAGSITGNLNRAMFEDLAMLLNTTIINRTLESDISSAVKEYDGNIWEVIDIFNRDIPGIKTTVLDADGNRRWSVDNGHMKDQYRIPLKDKKIQAGFVGKAVLGLKNGSTFDNLHYNEELYQKTIASIERDLTEAKKKSEALESYNFEAKDLQTRLFGLRMKIGIIEAGGESKLSQELLYDAIEDTVKATSSAYHNGILKGCSVSTIRAAKRVYEQFKENSIDQMNAKFIYEGFRTVYKTLLGTTGNDFQIKIEPSSEENILIKISEMFEKEWGIRMDFMKFRNIIISTTLFKIDEYREKGIDTTAFDFIIDLSIDLNCAFDLSTRKFNPNIINSAKTDKEILLATSDLISLLITGNQFIIADH